MGELCFCLLSPLESSSFKRNLVVFLNIGQFKNFYHLERSRMSSFLIFKQKLVSSGPLSNSKFGTIQKLLHLDHSRIVMFWTIPDILNSGLFQIFCILDHCRFVVRCLMVLGRRQIVSDGLSWRLRSRALWKYITLREGLRKKWQIIHILWKSVLPHPPLIHIGQS